MISARSESTALSQFRSPYKSPQTKYRFAPRRKEEFERDYSEEENREEEPKKKPSTNHFVNSIRESDITLAVKLVSTGLVYS